MSLALIPYPQIPSFPEGAPLAIHPFGILVALGILVGALLTIRRGRFLGLNDDKLKNMIFSTVLSGVVVSHITDVLIYQEHPTTGKLLLALLDLRTGLSSMGGFAGAVLGLYVWCRKNRERVFPYADALAYGLATGWFFGRTGCYVAHDHPGNRMNPGDPFYFLGVDYPCPEVPCGVKGDDLFYVGNQFRRHDMGFEEAMFAGLLALFFLILGRFKPRLGVFVAWIATIYGPVRLGLDTLRIRAGAHADVRWLGLTPAQYAAFLVTAIGLSLWYFVAKQPKQPREPDAPA